jgi:CDGSH-type Zn-finger protein
MNPEASKVRIQCVENGPYIVRGLDTLIGSDGQAIATKPMMALCRCGGSKSKPFCDGTHSKIGFQSETPSASR